MRRLACIRTRARPVLWGDAAEMRPGEGPMRAISAACLAILLLTTSAATAQDNYESWPVLRSTFPSTGGGGIIIKGYDPVITGGKCVTTFMAVEPGAEPKVYSNVIEYEAVAAQGGTLCQNG